MWIILLSAPFVVSFIDLHNKKYDNLWHILYDILYEIYIYNLLLLFSITDESVIILVLVFLSKILVSGGFTCLYIVAAEQFPSQMRSGAISLLASVGKCMGMLSPFIAYLVSTWVYTCSYQNRHLLYYCLAYTTSTANFFSLCTVRVYRSWYLGCCPLWLVQCCFCFRKPEENHCHRASRM